MNIPTFNNNLKIFENIFNTEPTIGTTHDGKHSSSSSSSLESEFGDTTALAAQVEAITEDATTSGTHTTRTTNASGTVDSSTEGLLSAPSQKKKKTQN